MKSTARLMYRAIWENPDDDAPRLIFADCLDETGKLPNVERAELIRLQILGGDDTADQRCADIVAKWHRRWHARKSGNPLNGAGCVYRRGFVDQYTIDLTQSEDGDTFIGVMECVVQFYPTVTRFGASGFTPIPAREGYDINGRAVYVADTWRVFPGQPCVWVEGTEPEKMCFVQPEILELVGATGPQFDIPGATAADAINEFGYLLAAACRARLGLPVAKR